MILREIKNIYIKNRLTEGVDFKRYEWLKADIPSGRIMMSLPISSRNFEFKRNFIQLFNSAYFSTSNSNTSYSYFIDNYVQDSSAKFPKIWETAERSVVYSSTYIGLGIHTIIANDNGVTISGNSNTASLPWYGNPTYIRFNNAQDKNIHTIHLTSSIKVDGVTRYIPCQLLKPTPATLDANNIARQTGECGMYDSISGKFYGNVANSGTFTIEGDVEPENNSGLQQIYQNKLIEGEDYETYDWLKMDIPESTIIDMMSLPINSNNVEFKRNWIQITNSEYFRTSNYIYYITDYGEMHDLHPMVWSITPSQIQYMGNINLGLGLHTIITNSNRVTISANSKVASLSWYGNQIAYMKFNSMMIFNTKTIHLTSSIKVDGVIRYVPCTLLRSIPRNLDAQCKERQAGECGMIDLISGKFYGNVANSGTFTVENDNNE